MIHVSAKDFDLSGTLDITPLPSSRGTGEMSRRASRVATLDGGVAVNDRGFSHGDRDIIYSYKPVSKAHDAIARRLVTLHTRVILCNQEGCFECIPGPFVSTSNENTFTFKVIEKLSED